ncbi:MAG: hypothetical protein K6A67_04070 [Bacteroidales bacterium]|nr:hypothetical protein [Bacteroidales bacterium]
MSTIDISAIILAVIGMVSGWVSYWLDRRKHRQEVESLRADNLQKEMNLSKDYVAEWRTFIAEPLQREVSQLRDEVNQLRNAIQRIDRCPHRDNCPVYERLRDQPTHGVG